jgi:HSP20 family protein
MALVKFNEGRESTPTHSGFSDIFENFFNDSFISDRMISRVPAVNIAESEGHYHIELAAPGLKKEDFKLDLDRNVLTISAEKTTEQENNDKQGKQYNKREYSYTSFVRSFTLPDSADDAKIDASYTDGVLKIDVAKKEEAKTVRRQISIK